MHVVDVLIRTRSVKPCILGTRTSPAFLLQ